MCIPWKLDTPQFWTENGRVGSNDCQISTVAIGGIPAVPAWIDSTSNDWKDAIVRNNLETSFEIKY